MTLVLIDADILVYESAHRCQNTMDWGDGVPVRTASFEEATCDFMSSIEYIQKETRATTTMLALTDSNRDSNFRRRVWPDYKKQRDTGKSTERPLLYSALRAWIRTKYDTKEVRGIEGDDTLGIIMTQNPGAIIASIDKDMMTIPGCHFNWRHPKLGITTVTEDEAFEALMFQTLTGDSTDNYPGCPGIGVINAARIMQEARGQSRREIWEHVCIAFEYAGLTREDALRQARCARILHACDWNKELKQPILWVEPKEEE